MKKITLVILSLYLAFSMLSSCSNQDKGAAFLLDSNATEEAFFGVIESFTSGMIVENEPLQVRFCSGITLKKQMGEDISSDAFSIDPSVKGKAYWMDQQTIGFRFDEIPEVQKVHHVKFDLSEFIETPKDLKPFEFSFVIRQQDFDVKDITYLCRDENTCRYELALIFSSPVDPQIVEMMLDKKTINDYQCKVVAVAANEVQLTIGNIPRKKSSYNIDIKLDGSVLDIDKNLKKELFIPAINIFEPLNYSLNKKEKSITIQFSNLLNQRQDFTGFIEFSKNTSYKTEVNDNCLIIYCDNDNTIQNSFDITILKGISDDNHRTLENDFQMKNVVLNDLVPKVKWSDDGVVVPDDKNTTIYFDAICLKSVTLRIIKIYDDNVLSFLQENDLDESFNMQRVGKIEKKIKLQLENTDYSRWKTYPIKLSDYVSVSKGAMYQITLDFNREDYPFACETTNEKAIEIDEKDYWNNESYSYKSYYYEDEWWEKDDDPCHLSFYNYVEIKKNVFVSNIAVIAKTADEGVVDIFVRKISDAKPISNATVQLMDFQRQIVGEATTDKHGFCSVVYQNKPWFVLVQDSEGGKSYLKLSNNKALSMSKFDVSGTSVVHNINGFIYSNRNVWRPGDKININFMLSDKTNQLPKNFPVVLELLDANGRVRYKTVNNAPKGKIWAFEVSTDVTDATGFWTATVKVGNQKFSKMLRVETVKPNRLKIDFQLPDLISLQKNQEVKLKSQWLNGLNASNLSATIDVSLKNGKTQFKNFPQYSFDNESSEFYGSTTSLFSSKLSSDGSKMVSFQPLQSVSATGFLNAVFTTKVFETNGDFSIATQTSKISPYQRYVGVALPETKSKYGNYYFTDEEWNFYVAVVDENGKLSSSDVELEGNIYQLDDYWWWNNDQDELGKYARGTYKKPVKTFSIACKNGKGAFRLRFSDKEWGAYLMVIEDKEYGHVFSKVINFDVSNNAFRSNNVGDAPAIIGLKSDKTTYKVGDKMIFSFPANSDAKALITVESASNVLQTIVLESLSEDEIVSITATKEMVPNVYVYVSLIQPYNKKNDLPLRMYGVAAVTVVDETTLLHPTISMPKTTESNKEIEIKVSENEGRAMYYTLALVDEGILGLTNYKTPDPYGHFFSKQALNVRTWDNYNDVIDVFTGELNSVFAVGGDLSIVNQDALLLERFSSVAFMLGPFKLEKGKTASHQVKIPEYFGSLRAMVVATDGKGAFGSAQKNIAVKDPMMLIPTAPRVVSPKDRLSIPWQILATELKNKEVTLSISAKNLNIVNNPTISAKINNEGEAIVNVEVTVPETKGSACLSITATAGSVSKKTEIIIPIRVPYSPKHQMVTEEIAPKTTKTINMNVQGIAGTLNGDLTINAAIPVDLFRRLDMLIDYPHGCLEQTVSKGFPQLYLDDLVGLDETTKVEMKNNIEVAISKMKSYLRSDYSMTNWIGGNYVTPWTELYAAHFLIEAKMKGYAVSDEMLKNIIKYQATKANAWRYNSDYPSDETIQAYRLFVLSLNNTAEIGAMNRFKSLQTKYPLTKALLASAYAMVGKKKTAEEILPVIDLTSSKMESDWYTSYGSKTRDLAMMTYSKMLTDGNSDYVKQYINQICKVLGSKQYMCTQTTAFSLFVLGKYAEMNGYKNTSVSATATVNGKEKAINTNLPFGTYSFVPKNGNNVIAVTNNSDAAIFASVYTKGTVAEYEIVEKGNWYKMSVNYYDKSNKKIDPKKLTRNTDFYVKIEIENPSQYPVTENALSYLIPSGWEIINDRIFSDNDYSQSKYNFIDIRDDRVCFYFDLAPNEKMSFTVSLNATYSGSFTIPAVHCEDMYNDEIYYIIPAKAVEVE